MSTTQRTWTEEELMRLPEDGLKRELVDGEIVVSPAGPRHGAMVMKLGVRLGSHVEERRLGHLFDSSTGVWMPGGNLRVPDLSYVSHLRMPVLPERGFSRVVPDLAVEVLSPDDSRRGILDKIGEYLASGVRMAWVIDPAERRAASYRSLTRVREIDADGSLDGEDVVPGFRCPLADVVA